MAAPELLELIQGMLATLDSTTLHSIVETCDVEIVNRMVNDTSEY